MRCIIENKKQECIFDEIYIMRRFSIVLQKNISIKKLYLISCYLFYSLRVSLDI